MPKGNSKMNQWYVQDVAKAYLPDFSNHLFVQKNEIFIRVRRQTFNMFQLRLIYKFFQKTFALK